MSKSIYTLLLFWFSITFLSAQSETKFVSTSLGEIAYDINEVDNTTPIIFLHGVYLDRHLWKEIKNQFADHTTIVIDMPLHGESKDITKKDWTMADCSAMLIELLDELQIESCIAVGHSWGSMVILRAASNHPDRFQGIGLCNLPLKAGDFWTKVQFGFIHGALVFKKFFIKQTIRKIVAKESRKKMPEISGYITSTMANLSKREIKKTNKEVITNVDDGHQYFDLIKIPMLLIKGEKDKVPKLDSDQLIVVPGKHISPLEAPDEVIKMIRQLMIIKE